MKTSPEASLSLKTIDLLVIGSLIGMSLCVCLFATYIFGKTSSPDSSHRTQTAPSADISTILPTPSTSAITQAVTANPPGTISQIPGKIPTKQSTPVPDRQLGRVTKVIDGDTIEVSIEGVVYPLRYIGIDTPERGEIFSSQSTEANRKLVENQVVELEKDVSDVDQFGRLLRYVYLTDGRMVNATLVAMGYAIAKAYPPDIKNQNLFEIQENHARAALLGMWQPATPTSTISTDDSSEKSVIVDQSCSQFNAPGDDNKNLVQEYVCFRNAGAQSVDLTNWIMQDEYGWAFTFPDFTLPVGETVKIHTGCGEADQSDLYWCRTETAIWNNAGDCVHLFDPDGNQVHEFCY